MAQGGIDDTESPETQAPALTQASQGDGKNWVLVKFIPASIDQWDPETDTLDGSEKKGDKKDNQSAWQVKYSNLLFDEMKVESNDKSHSKVYPKG